MIKTYTYHLVGVAPLLMHNPQSIDPQNQYSKAIKAFTSKRKKTDEDNAQIAKLEWFGALYLNEKKEPVLPGEMVEGAFFSAAKIYKLGKKAKACIWSEGMFPIKHAGPKDLEKMYADDNFRFYTSVVVAQRRIMRMRPIFKNWECDVKISVDTNMLEEKDVLQIMQAAGRECGIGDWRPRFGRFEVKE